MPKRVDAAGLRKASRIQPNQSTGGKRRPGHCGRRLQLLFELHPAALQLSENLRRLL